MLKCLLKSVIMISLDFLDFEKVKKFVETEGKLPSQSSKITEEKSLGS